MNLYIAESVAHVAVCCSCCNVFPNVPQGDGRDLAEDLQPDHRALRGEVQGQRNLVPWGQGQCEDLNPVLGHTHSPYFSMALPSASPTPLASSSLSLKLSTIPAALQELSYCTLRAQLLMTIHDDSGVVASKDRCHGLAWTLDAGIMNGHLTEKHLVKLEQYFQEVWNMNEVSKAEVKCIKSRIGFSFTIHLDLTLLLITDRQGGA